jgi:hypothetical protein
VDSREWSVPSYDIDTKRGDVVVFHSNLLHASAGGNLRLSWDTSYFLCPSVGGTEQGEMIRDAVLHTGNYSVHPYDHEKWSTWRDWIAEVGTDSRKTAVRRLERLGVLEVEGADIGTPKWEPVLSNPFPQVSGAPIRARSSK